MCEKIRVAGIVEDSITDGPGLRLTIFLQGCNRDCEGCHNPAARHMEGGTMYTVEEVAERIRRNPLLSGVTLSGGEPLLQAGKLAPLARRIKAAELDLAVYTGYTLEEILEQNNTKVLELLQFADTLVDGAFVKEQRNLSLPFRGSANQRILDVRESLVQRKAVLKQDAAWNGE